MADNGKSLFVFRVGESEIGLRLDIFLTDKDISLSRSQVKRIISDGNVLVNDMIVKSGHRLKEGDTVVLHKAKPKTYHVVPQDIPITTLYEDESIIVVDKPAGMVVHPAAGNYDGTLVNALLFHCQDLTGIGGILRPGIVHRLDKDTSGLMVVAKSDGAHAALTSQFKKRLVKKIYKALVHGNVTEDEGMIEMPIGRHPKHRKKMSVHSKKGKVSVTRWSVVHRFGIVTLLDVAIETGRTHQIRVHLHSKGYPVVGDSVYGNSRKKINEIKQEVPRNILKTIKRQALHSSLIGFYHPVTQEYMELASPLPEDMASVCRRMHEYGQTGK